MARKKREIRAEYRRAGFTERPGKGDHTVFSHSLVKRGYVVDGRDGADALPYDERNLRNAKRELAEAMRGQGRRPRQP